MQAMKIIECGENGIMAPLSLQLDTTWSASRLGRFNSRENSLVSHWASGEVWAFLRETFCPICESNHDSFIVQSVALSL